MAKPVLPVDEILDILRTSVPRIAALTDGLAPARLRASPGPDVWSVNDLLAHLRASHDVLGGILRILSQDAPSWKRLSPRAWIRKTDYPTWAFEPAFAAFRAHRADLLEAIEPLSLEAWARTARVTEPTGETRDRTAQFYGDWLAAHERLHLGQMAEVLAELDDP